MHWYTINTPSKGGYVFSISVRGADKELKKYVLDESGYEWLGVEYKRKSRRYPRNILVTSATGRKMKKTVDEKQVIFYSEKYAKRAKAERAAALAKAQDLAAHPGNYTREIDEEKLKEEEALDGYYCLVTSEIKEHIEGHFLTCFVALTLARILEMELNHKYSIGKMLDSLRKCECSHVQQNYYLFDYYDEVLSDIGSVVNIDFSKKIRTYAEMKKILGETKRVKKTP